MQNLPEQRRALLPLYVFSDEYKSYTASHSTSASSATTEGHTRSPIIHKGGTSKGWAIIGLPGWKALNMNLSLRGDRYCIELLEPVVKRDLL
jgi:hypothetical protein